MVMEISSSEGVHRGFCGYAALHYNKLRNRSVHVCVLQVDTMVSAAVHACIHLGVYSGPYWLIPPGNSL